MFYYSSPFTTKEFCINIKNTVAGISSYKSHNMLVKGRVTISVEVTIYIKKLYLLLKVTLYPLYRPTAQSILLKMDNLKTGFSDKYDI